VRQQVTSGAAGLSCKGHHAGQTSLTLPQLMPKLQCAAFFSPAARLNTEPLILTNLESAMAESVHRKLERVRPPRVHITYDVEVGDAIQLKEIPFVMGVLGDFSGQPSEPLPRLRDRKFVEVTPDNFDDVLASMKPRLTFKVDNKLSDEAGKLGVELKFESLDDFSPERVAQQVDPLRKLLELRQQLADLRGSLQGNDKLEEILQASVTDADRLNKLKTELEAEGATDVDA
jgi:type VI secretion system protein ImpB